MRGIKLRKGIGRITLIAVIVVIVVVAVVSGSLAYLTSRHPSTTYNLHNHYFQHSYLYEHG